MSYLAAARRLRPYFAIFALLVFARLASAAATAPATQAATTQAATDEEHFLRFVGDGTTGGTLETSEATYQNDAGVKIHLVSAVHIAEAAYFRDIQMSFEGRDAVLYEMVKSKDAPAPTKGMHS